MRISNRQLVWQKLLTSGPWAASLQPFVKLYQNLFITFQVLQPTGKQTQSHNVFHWWHSQIKLGAINAAALGSFVK